MLPGHHGEVAQFAWGQRPNVSRLSCGRRVRQRKAVERQTKRLGGEATQFLPTREADVAELIARAKEGGSVPERLANIKSPPAIRGRKPCQLYHRSSRRNLVTDRYE